MTCSARRAPGVLLCGIGLGWAGGGTGGVLGGDRGRLEGPVYAEGYLPITEMTYATRDGAVFAQEAFVSTDAELADDGVVFVKFTLVKSAGVKRGGRAAAA